MDTTVKTCATCLHTAKSMLQSPCSGCDYNYPHWVPQRKPPEVQPELDLGIAAVSAPAILQDAADILKERGQSRDKGDSERSMATVVNIFNAAEGLNLTEEQGWKFMLCLKLGRMKGGKFHFDDYQDLVGYSALMAECAANTQLTLKAND